MQHGTVLGGKDIKINKTWSLHLRRKMCKQIIQYKIYFKSVIEML